MVVQDDQFLLGGPKSAVEVVWRTTGRLHLILSTL